MPEPGSHVSRLSGSVSGMTPPPLRPPSDTQSPIGGGPHGSGGGVATLPPAEAFRTLAEAGVLGPLWFVAEAPGRPFGEPFRMESERDEWAADQLRRRVATAIRLSVHGMDDVPQLHMGGEVRSTIPGLYEFRCTGLDCTGRWNGPYDTPQAAIASWRQHKPARP